MWFHRGTGKHLSNSGGQQGTVKKQAPDLRGPTDRTPTELKKKCSSKCWQQIPQLLFIYSFACSFTERRTDGISFICCITFIHGHYSWSWANLKPKARSFFWASLRSVGVKGLESPSAASLAISTEQPGQGLVVPIWDSDAAGRGFAC